MPVPAHVPVRFAADEAGGGVAAVGAEGAEAGEPQPASAMSSAAVAGGARIFTRLQYLPGPVLNRICEGDVFALALIPFALQLFTPGAQRRLAPAFPLFDGFHGKDRFCAGVVSVFTDAIFCPPVFCLCGVALPQPVARVAQPIEWRMLPCFRRPLDAHESRRIKFQANGCALGLTISSRVDCRA